MAYVDGFLIPLPSKNRAAYKKMARKFGKICMELGATSYHECIADDVKRMIYGGFKPFVEF